MKKLLLLLLLSTLLIFACKNKIEESTEVSELTNKQSPTEFFSYAPEDILIEKCWRCWGPSELKPYGEMGQRLIEDIKVNGLNPKGYIFYRKQKIFPNNLVLIKYGPLIIPDSIYNKIKSEDLKIGLGDIITESTTSRGGNIYYEGNIYIEAERKYFESKKKNLIDSIITVPIKLDLRIRRGN
tara:strand:+ start:3487 stop:4035 length:549 start_codon:yes stop_codon:yes gene_type:complete